MLGQGVWTGGGQLTAAKVAAKPELAVANFRLGQLFDVQKLGWLDDQAGFLLRFACGRLVQLLKPLYAATRCNPEVVAPWANMTNEKDAFVVFNDHPGGDATLQCEA